MKIYIRTELNKGYIPSDKQHLNGISFEFVGLKFFLTDEQANNLLTEYKRDLYNKFMRKAHLEQLKALIYKSDKFKEIEKEGYHKYLYLNLNNDGIDLFISR